MRGAGCIGMSDKLPVFPTLAFENKYWAQAGQTVAGLDEAGRGAWAGPVAAAAVVLPQMEGLQQALSGVRDSKLMTAQQRTSWAAIIKTVALSWGIGFSTAQEIDALGIIAATRLAMQRALNQLLPQPTVLLMDALTLPESTVQQEALIKGDRLCLSIAAASVLAKTARDAEMVEQDLLYPRYGFAAHKGYGTPRHQQALQEVGPCPIHRFYFKPLRDLKCPSQSRTSLA